MGALLRKGEASMIFRVLLIALLLLPVSRALAEDTDPPTITLDPVVAPARGGQVRFSAHIEDDSEIFAPTLYFRFPGARGYSSVALARSGERWVGTVVMSDDLEYWVE